MHIVAWMVLLSSNDLEAYYIDMAIKSIIDHVDALYIQDQGCTDSTLDIARKTVDNKIPLVIEENKTDLPRFHPDYAEPIFRSAALERAEEIFKPDFLLKIDADDVYTEYFYEQVKLLENQGTFLLYNSLRHSSERFITPEYRSQSPHARQIVDGVPFYDAHIHFWKAGLNVRFVKNPGQTGWFHNVLQPVPEPVLWLPGICNIHLHRSFGPKAFKFWAEGGDVFEETIPFNPRRQAPQWFNSQMNMGYAVRTDFQWPAYIMEKWKKWGVYE